MIQMNLFTKEKQTHRHRKQTTVTKGKRGGENGMDWEFGVNRYKLLPLEWISKEIMLYSIGNYIITYNGA